MDMFQQTRVYYTLIVDHGFKGPTGWEDQGAKYTRPHELIKRGQSKPELRGGAAT